VAKPRKGGMVNGNVTINNGSLLRCTLEGLPDGDTDIEISVADHRGHVTVLKAAVTVETTPPYIDPVLTINAPLDGQAFPQGSSIAIGHSIVGVGPFTYRCLVDTVVVLTDCTS
jgi:hypothetical protein